jgi:hypothetical protein
MFASDVSRRATRCGAAGLFAALVLLAAACGQPTAIPPTATDALRLFLVLDPDTTSQPLLVQRMTAGETLQGLRGSIRQGAAVVAAAAGQEDWRNEFSPCRARYGTLPANAFPRCLDFALRPLPGATYHVEVAAEGHRPATATITVPGDFTLREVRASGNPPGATALDVRWSPSEHAYRYLVALRPQTLPRCVEINDCDQGWYAVTADTVLMATVPAEAVQGAGGPWWVDVYAVERALYEYLTTGATGDLFPVPPLQNVEGGYGAIGAWVRRSAPLPDGL